MIVSWLNGLLFSVPGEFQRNPTMKSSFTTETRSSFDNWHTQLRERRRVILQGRLFRKQMFPNTLPVQRWSTRTHCILIWHQKYTTRNLLLRRYCCQQMSPSSKVCFNWKFSLVLCISQFGSNSQKRGSPWQHGLVWRRWRHCEKS